MTSCDRPDLSRRRLLQLAASVAAGLVLAKGRGAAAGEDAPLVALPVPRLVEPDPAGRIRLDIGSGRHSFRAGAAPTKSLGVSADFLGPVLRLQTGSTVLPSVRNGLDEPTSLHWHGILVPAEMDGGPHNPIAPLAVWTPELAIRQPPTTGWYHPHIHHQTARQTYLGLAGMVIIADKGDRDRGLPSTYGVDDVPLIIQDRRLGGDGSYAPDLMDLVHGFRGETIIVNGVVRARLAVPRGMVRLRLLNAANARNFDLGFADRRVMHVIASDGGYLSRPVAVESVLVAPGERYEVLVDFADGRPIDLVALPEADRPMAQMPGMKTMARQADRVAILRFVPEDALAVTMRRVPDRLADLDAPGIAAVRRRHFVLDDMSAANMPRLMEAGAGAMAGMDHSSHEARGAAEAGRAVLPEQSGLVMAIAGKPFAMDRVDARVRLGSSEIWTLESREMPHPFHIHGATFRVLSEAGIAPPAHRAGAKDTVLVDTRTELLVSFNQPASARKPFMFHCHILEHEDLGMMGQYVTV